MERLTAGEVRSEMPPRLVVRRLEGLHEQIEKPAHRWLKGMMCGRALALDDERQRR